MNFANFPLGRLLITPGAVELLETHGIAACKLLQRHVSADWGDIGAEDWEANNQALLNGERVLSAYLLDKESGQDGDKVWIITEADRSSTTILLPDEY